jgi:hypothetical protein
MWKSIGLLMFQNGDQYCERSSVFKSMGECFVWFQSRRTLEDSIALPVKDRTFKANAAGAISTSLLQKGRYGEVTSSKCRKIPI